MAHDNAGNMIQVPKLDGSGERFHLNYDAWNRLVKVYDDNGTTLVAEYSYDGGGRRILKGWDEGTDGQFDQFTHFFLAPRQVIETRQGEDQSGEPPPAEGLDPKQQFVWSPRYIHSLFLRDENIDGDATCTDPDDKRLFYLADANDNVKAVVAFNDQTETWHVAERYLYDPYGRVTILNGDTAGSQGACVARTRRPTRRAVIVRRSVPDLPGCAIL